MIIPGNSIFKSVGQNICKTFPTETLKTYYKSPVLKKDNAEHKSIPSTGKIPIKWRNLQAELKINKLTDKLDDPMEVDAADEGKKLELNLVV